MHTHIDHMQENCLDCKTVEYIITALHIRARACPSTLNLVPTPMHRFEVPSHQVTS